MSDDKVKYIPLKQTADNVCGACGNPVPYDSLNRFYCSEGCCRAAYAYFHPEEKQDYHEIYNTNGN